VATVALGAAAGCGVVARVQEPRFAVELREGDLEVRRYEPRVVAETVVSGSRKEAENEGFRRLAGYIFGGNQDHSNAMTAPVGQKPEGRKLAMTAPVGQKPDGDAWMVSFTMPEGETLGSLPEPNDSRVTLRGLPPVRVAVIKFSGRWTDESFATHAERLRAWTSLRGLHAAGEPEVNRYDPPWTLWFMRRNEVWLALDGEPAPAPGPSAPER
jgi:hypothetical protein